MQSKQYKLVLLGNTNSGKTAIAKRFCESNKSREIQSVNPSSKSIKTQYQRADNFDWNKAYHPPFQNYTSPPNTYPINILEIAGSNKDAAAGKVKEYQPDGIIIVVDSTDPFNAESFQHWLKTAIENSPPTAHICICLSKNDDADYCDDLKAAIKSASEKAFKNRDFPIEDCSAQQNAGIKELFKQVCQSIQTIQKTNVASAGWYDFFFKGYPNWLIGLMALSLLIEVANLALQIVAFFPAGQFLALGLSFDYAAPVMHMVLWAGISLVTWGICVLLKKAIEPPSELTTLDNPDVSFLLPQASTPSFNAASFTSTISQRGAQNSLRPAACPPNQGKMLS